MDIAILDTKKIFCCIFFLQFLVIKNPGSGLDPDPDSLEMLDPYLDPDPYPYPDSMNADPQPWLSFAWFLLNKAEHRAYHCIV
jgi:hypothetical protein